MNDYNYIDMVRLCNKAAWEIADRREKKMRLIDADALKEWVKTEEETKWGLSTDEVWDAIESAPTIEPKYCLLCEDGDEYTPCGIRIKEVEDEAD